MEFCKSFQAIGEQHPNIKWLKGIISNTKPNPEKLFVGEGLWLGKMILDSGNKIRAIFICPELVRTEEEENLVNALSVKCDERYTVSAKTFEKLSEKPNSDGIIVLATLRLCDADGFKPQKESVVLVLDGIEIPGNIGTMLRMCDGAGVEAVFICNRKARLTHPKLIRSSQGAVLTVPMYEFETEKECFDLLEKKGYTVFLADTRAQKHYCEIDYPSKTAFVMGSERYGISRKWYDFKHEMVSIPMYGKCDSLNVGVAATVLVYEATVKKKTLRSEK
ncbi:MAG: hypothetical protein IKC83_02240 [Clostridia bacterium]|nr:hypothetical protein [Clostridia bacterium]